MRDVIKWWIFFTEHGVNLKEGRKIPEDTQINKSKINRQRHGLKWKRQTEKIIVHMTQHRKLKTN